MVIRELFSELRRSLERGGIENPRFEAEQLLQGVGLDKPVLITEPDKELSENICAEISEKLERRLSGEPLQYILGEWEFYGLPFRVGEGVLIPRQDTETLVEVSARFLKDRSENARRTLDLCAGSGCVGIALAKLFGATVVCVEKSEEAFGYLKRNIALNKVEDSVKPVSGDVFDGTRGEFDLIVSNPPYLTESDMDDLQREVRREPRTALFGGADGLDFYRRIPRIYAKNLLDGGMLAVEIGMGQEEPVSEYFRAVGIEPRCEKDLCGINRVVYGIK